MVMRAESLVTYVSFDKKGLEEEGLFQIRLPTVDFASAVYETKLQHVWDVEELHLHLFDVYWTIGYSSEDNGLIYVLHTEVCVNHLVFVEIHLVIILI